LAGVMLVMMGVFKLGSLIKFIPRSVTIGFTSGIAVIIFSGQIGDFLGLEGLENKEYFHENMLQIFINLSTINGYSVLTAIIGFSIIFLLPILFPPVALLLVALTVPTLISVVFLPSHNATIGTAFSVISQTLPSLQFPQITWQKLLTLSQPAFFMAMPGEIESS